MNAAVVLAVALLSAGATPTTGGLTTAQLRYHLRPGVAHAYDALVTQTVALGLRPVKTTIATRYTETVKQIAPGTGIALLETRYDNVDVTLEQGGTPAPQSVLAPVEKALSQVAVLRRTSPTGHVHDRSVRHVSATVKVLTSALETAMIGVAPEFPEDALAVGDPWQEAVLVESQQGPLTLATTYVVSYRLTGLSHQGGADLAEIDVSVTMALPETRATIGGDTAVVTGTGEGSGQLVWSRSAGRLASSQLAMTQVLTIADGSKEDAAPPMTLHVATEARVSHRPAAE